MLNLNSDSLNLNPLFYKLIYNSRINFLIRNSLFPFRSLLKESLQIPPSGIVNLKTDSGIIKIATNQTSYLTKLLFWDGYKSFEYSEIFEKLLKKVECFFDIGANLGYYSLLAAKANPDIKIYAFEPATGPKHYLGENVLLNNMGHNIITVDFALSSRSNAIEFYEVKSTKYNYLEKNLSGEHNAGTKKETRNFIKTTVQAISLSNFIKDKNIQSIDLIKIDTEGTEVEILQSGREYIEKFKPIVICETLYNTTESDLTTFFEKLEYKFYNHSETGLEEVSTLRRMKDNGIRNCFFVPLEKVHLIAEFVAKN